MESTIKTQLLNEVLNVGSGVEYDKAVSDLFDQKSGSFSVKQQVEKMNIDQFVLIIENFIYQVLESAAPLES